MYCKNCGKEIADDSTYCSYCSTRQVDLNQVTTESIALNADSDHNREETSNNKESVNQPKTKMEEKYTAATFVGVTLLIIYIVVYFYGSELLSLYGPYIIILNFLRILLTVWSVNIAKKQNRNHIGWGVFTFLIPFVAITLISLLRKVNEHTPIRDYEEFKKVKEENKMNRIVTFETKDNQTLQIHTALSSGYTVGDIVTIDDQIAQDGKYRIGFSDWISIKDGRVNSL